MLVNTVPDDCLMYIILIFNIAPVVNVFMLSIKNNKKKKNSKGKLKFRCNNYTQSLRQAFDINDTDLSKYFWTLKANVAAQHLKWSIKQYTSRYKCCIRRCDLYMTVQK